MSLALALHLLATVFQVAAAVLALRLIAVSGRRLAWILLALSFSVRVIRLGIQTVLYFKGSYRLILVEEWFSLAVSVLALAGVLLIRPIFLAFREAEAANERMLKEIEVYSHTVSHDLRTPLTVVLGHAQILDERLRSAGNGGALLPSVEAIAQGAHQMNAMIGTLTEVARIEGGQLKVELQALDLEARMNDLLKRSAVVVPQERVRCEIPRGIPAVLADPVLLERVVLNLLTNALKYSETDSGVVLLTAEARADEVVLMVQDSGPGISAQMMPHLFERFYRGEGGERDREGLGLGLYICKSLTEMQGGRIWAQSAKPRGSIFCVALRYAV